jgi:hypothetical protein
LEIIKYQLLCGAVAQAAPRGTVPFLLLRLALAAGSQSRGGARSFNRWPASGLPDGLTQALCCSAAMNRAATGTSRGTIGEFAASPGMDVRAYGLSQAWIRP